MGAEPRGFISLLDEFIGGIFVSPDREGIGIGRKLVAHALSLKGELELKVYIDNQQAMVCDHELGFQELSRRPHDDDGYAFENVHLRLIG
jgi:GNAT superfamily N-acetyltransferase